MTELNDLHDRAMDLVFMARIERRRGNNQLATQMFEEALECEIEAVESLDGVIEPTYSVLRRSAGWIAVDCGEFRLAERLACQALAAEPPPGIAAELRELLDRAMLSIRLQPEGVVLQDGDVDLCLSGNTISAQCASFSDVFGRANSFQKMYFRVAQWQNIPEYSRIVPSWVRQQYPLFVAPNRSDSYGVSFRLGGMGSQPGLFAGPEPSEIVANMIKLFATIDQAGSDGLAKEGLNGEYQHSIARLVKQIAPDGSRVRRVGVVAASGKDTQMVNLQRRASEIKLIGDSERVVPGTMREVRGVLRVADAGAEQRRIVSVHPVGGGPPVLFHVPPAWMDDVVGHMWNTDVFASGVYQSGPGAELRLVDIHGAGDGVRLTPGGWQVYLHDTGSLSDFDVRGVPDAGG